MAFPIADTVAADDSYMYQYYDSLNTYSMKDVWTKEVRYSNGNQYRYEQMYIREEDRHTPKFEMPDNNNNLPPNVQTLTDLFFSDEILRTIKTNTNRYIKLRKRDVKPIDCDEIVIFFAIVLYMGIVQLPSKKDYWNNKGMWPTHRPCTKMSYYRRSSMKFRTTL